MKNIFKVPTKFPFVIVGVAVLFLLLAFLGTELFLHKSVVKINFAAKTVNAEEVKTTGESKTQVSKFTPVLADRKQVGKSQTTVRTAAVRKTGER
jgi:hypothetical protein